ncbi:MAG: hypothetical protein JRI23_17870, partial [Deltaproteobacteria bacterium]|nr:hypothetical protein [Deltaproteobacteria bacterium]MBW2533706.1 hypothetical protein [Deltaproteobacteria bacterium]
MCRQRRSAVMSSNAWAADGGVWAIRLALGLLVGGWLAACGARDVGWFDVEGAGGATAGSGGSGAAGGVAGSG